MSEQPAELPQGTLDMLILKTLALTPLHGLGIARRIEEVTLPIYAVHTMDEMVAASVEQPRLSLDLLGLFAGLAFALAAIGVYGVIAFAVNPRKHELGIRMALGGRPWDIRRMAIVQGARLALGGVALGLAGALYLTRYMAPLLFGMETRDPVTFAIVPMLLMGVTLAASSIPAVRATRVDPIKTLRHQ